MAREQVRHRYDALRARIPSQVAALQLDKDFRSLCKLYYGKGYKDWVILSAVINCMLNWQAQRHLDLRDAGDRARLPTMANDLNDTVYPAWRFTQEEMDRAVAGHNMAVLLRYGFEPRRADFQPKTVEKFLRERMRHFEADLPHEPLFGDPPGSWPEL
jgi:hypothetical protein